MRSTAFNDRYGAFFVDYDMVPLLVQQALPQSVQTPRGEAPTSKLARMADGLDAVVAGDLLSNCVRSRGQWSLLTSVAAMNVKAAYHASGSVAFPGFPEWFGKNSTTGKRRRLLGELGMHMNHRISGGTMALRMHYISSMRAAMYAPLLTDGAEGVPDTIAMLDAYGLSKQDLTESCVAAQRPVPLWCSLQILKCLPHTSLPTAQIGGVFIQGHHTRLLQPRPRCSEEQVDSCVQCRDAPQPGAAG